MMRVQAVRMLEYGQMSAEEKLKELGHILPPPPTAGGNYLSAKTVGSLVFLAGVISSDENGVIAGVVGSSHTIEDGYLAARCCALTQLAVLKKTLGSLDRVKQIVSLNGYVNAVSGFGESPQVINGASDLLVAVFGESGTPWQTPQFDL